MNEPMTNPVPTDAELYPAGWHDLGLEVYSEAGEDDELTREHMRDRIMRALHEQGEDELLQMLR